MEKIIRKTKIGWVITDTTLTAFDKLQATVYHAFETPNKKPLEEMRIEIENSAPDEYNSWVDVIGLATRKGLRGYGTRLQERWFRGESDTTLEIH